MATGSKLTVSIDLKLPTKWEDLSDKQLRYVFALLAQGFTATEVKAYCLHRWAGLKVLHRYGNVWACKHDGLQFILAAEQVERATHVLDWLDSEIAPRGIAQWQKPNGGYFVSVNTMPGIAKETWRLCKEAGLTMTGAGATFPYGRDPKDSNMRVAPSLPPTEQLEQAMEVYCISMRLAALNKLLA